MKQPTEKQYRLLVLTVVLSMAVLSISAQAGSDDDLVRISKMLKPIPDAQWNELLGPSVPDSYDIQKGDNLWNISKSIFGNPFYWPKVWTFNNTGGAMLGNPHLIEPGQKLHFKAGSSGEIPTLSDSTGAAPSAATAGQVSSADVAAAAKEHEYDRISPELWAPEEGADSASEYDQVSIDRDMKIITEGRFNFRAPSLMNESTLPYLGEIVGSRRDGSNLATGEVVFIKSNGQDLQVGSAYSVLSEATMVQEKKSERIGYAYNATGEIRIVGVKDSLYIGEIERGSDVIRRGDRLYPLLPLISGISPKVARAPVEGLALIDPSSSVSNVSQYRFLFFDRGLEDGVEVGNVFRIYDYHDPVTQKKITESDFLVSADAIVVHATAQFSTALILRALGTVSRGDFGILLTDISDLRGRKRREAKSLGGEVDARDKELDELDELDRNVGEGAGRQEELEVKELDYWDRTKDLEPTVPSDAGTPTDGTTAPSGGTDIPTEPLEPLEPLDSGAPDGETVAPPAPAEENAPLDKGSEPPAEATDDNLLPPE